MKGKSSLIRQITLLALTVSPILLVGLSELLFQLYNRSFWTTYTSSNSELAGDLVGDILVVDDKVWIGTDNGLNLVRPDGKWETYTTVDSGLLNNGVWALDVDDAKNIWIGHSDGLSVLRANGDWITYPKSYFNRDEEFFYVNAIAIDNLNQVWVGTNDGLFVLNQEEILTTYTEENSDLIDSNVRALNIDKSNKIWIGTNKGLNIFDPDNDNWITEQDVGSSDTQITSIFIDQHQRIWAGTDREGVAMRTSNDVWHTYTMSNSPLADNSVGSIVVDKQNRVWLDTRRGLNVFEAKNNIWRIYTASDSGLPDNSVRKLAIDNQNRLWIGAIRGVSTVDLEKELPVPQKIWGDLRSSAIRFIEFEGPFLLTLGAGSLAIPFPCGLMTLLLILSLMVFIYTTTAIWWGIFTGENWDRIVNLAIILILSFAYIAFIHYIGWEILVSGRIKLND